MTSESNDKEMAKPLVAPLAAPAAAMPGSLVRTIAPAPTASAPGPDHLDLASIRERLDAAKGPNYWRCLDEIAGTEGFQDFLHREFPRQASEWEDVDGRRNFLKLMGASLALAGLGACTRQPTETIMPYVNQPESVVPGRPLYFATARKLLKPGGVFLNHGIARSQFQGNRGDSFLHKSVVPFVRETLMFHRPKNSSFIDKYVFPDGELVTISQALKAAEGAGFEVRDLENLREHYELTLRGWVEGLERNRDALLKLVSEKTYRIWLLYMAGSAAAFRRGDLELYQTLLSNPDHGRSGLPLRRADWYGTERARSHEQQAVA